ncbi:hypothetical protein FTO74_11215 [Granulicella sp. WH15]|uniref:POTRA domain-containing protein n=1 Tax=Granulicella sp. WH15 TaxID=2602070 RepID=UPI0013668729|nr:POTRA domain-containing protein [Granulicella sp. WH15]QHN03878.1 hypothetical protein FTO74_11215 [Granulicella sp. WH15]
MLSFRLVPLALLCLSATSFAQTYTAQRVQFSEMGSFTQKQLEDASGIHAGTSFTAADLNSAAQRLANTGYFNDVGATLDGKTSAITVQFSVKPTPLDHMLHVGFENFIWLSHDEIEAAVKAKVPLFIDRLPENSPHNEEIKAALTEALAAKSINAEVHYDTFEPTLRHPERAVTFSIDRPTIRVANIKLAGVTPDLVPLVQKSVNSTARTRYTEGPADVTTANRILAPLLDAGYAQATLTDVVPAPTTAADGSIGIVLSAKLDAGEVFHVSGITYAGMPLFSTADFNAATKIHPGDLASRTALIASLAPIDAAYRRKGYMDVVIEATPTFDTTAHQVAYTVSVQPGEPYRIHEVTPNNLDPVARGDFDRNFLLKPGEIYNPEYVAGFIKNNTALRSFEGYSASFKAYADPDTHTVDLVINFIRTARPTAAGGGE